MPSITSIVAGVLLAIIAALGLYGLWERHQAGAAEAHVAQLELQLGQQQATVTSLRAAATAQNTAVDQLRAQAVAAQRQAEQESAARDAAAARVRTAYVDRVKAIEAAPVPAQCASAAAWAAGQAGQLSEGWK